MPLRKRCCQRLLLRLLADSDAEVRKSAAQAVGNIGVADVELAAALGRLLTDKDADVVLAAVTSLAEMGEAAVASTDSIAKLLGHESSSMRVAAIHCFAAVQKDQSQSVPTFIELLKDEDWTVRRAAAESLGAMKEGAKAAVPTLFVMLKDDVDTDFAKGAIQDIDTAGPDALPVLMTGLESEHRRSRYYAMFLIGKIGPDAAEALPLLEKLLKETESKRSRDMIRKAIDAIEGKEKGDE